MRKFITILLLVVLAFSTFSFVACDPTGPNSATTRFVELYAVNDFHGATEKIAKVGKYLKDRKDGNTILLSSGDMFQETLESNSNYGALINSCLEEIGFSCLTTGLSSAFTTTCF